MKVGVRLIAAAAAFVLPLAGQASGQTAPASGPQSHEAHEAAHDLPSDEPGEYFTVNLAIDDAGVQPASVFIPALRRVQLMLRTRGVSEHHYRIEGLIPDGLVWIAEPNSSAHGGADEEHHHARVFLPSRGRSPAGITPTGRDVHAYVTPARGVDILVFTPTNAGRFVVWCDLHEDELGSVTVFEAGGPAPPAASPMAGDSVARALTRQMETTGTAGAPAISVEALYVPPQQEARFLGPAGVGATGADQSVTLLVTELSHTESLPAAMPPPRLFVSSEPRALVDARVIATSTHHRATAYRFARDAQFGRSHQVMTLRLDSGQEATWHLPIAVPEGEVMGASVAGLGQSWGLILALLGGMVGAMWPCLFQLTVYFIPALAGIAMQDTGDASRQGRRRQVLRAAFFFILGFTLVYTVTGGLIGYAAQRFSDSSELETWQRYFGIAAGVVVIGLALRVAVKVRAPLVCRMPVLSWMARSKKTATPLEMMLAGLAFATSCMTCFGSALVVVMVVYVGLAQSAFYGALVLFLFSLGMAIPLVIAALAMARALPFLMRLETAVPWMGLASAILMIGFGVLLISGNYMAVSEWTYRLTSGSASIPIAVSGLFWLSAAAAVGVIGWLTWKARTPAEERPA